MDILVIHSLYIPYIFPRYVPCIFPCAFLNLWSQEKTSPYRRTTLLLFIFSDFTPSIFLLIIFRFFHQNQRFVKQNRAHMGPNSDRAPTRTGPQPGLGPNPARALIYHIFDTDAIMGKVAPWCTSDKGLSIMG